MAQAIDKGGVGRGLFWRRPKAPLLKGAVRSKDLTGGFFIAVRNWFCGGMWACRPTGRGARRITPRVILSERKSASVRISGVAFSWCAIGLGACRNRPGDPYGLRPQDDIVFFAGRNGLGGGVWAGRPYGCGLFWCGAGQRPPLTRGLSAGWLTGGETGAAIGFWGGCYPPLRVRCGSLCACRAACPQAAVSARAVIGLSLPPARRCRATSLIRGRRWARRGPKAPLSMAQATLSCRDRCGGNRFFRPYYTASGRGCVNNLLNIFPLLSAYRWIRGDFPWGQASGL